MRVVRFALRGLAALVVVALLVLGACLAYIYTGVRSGAAALSGTLETGVGAPVRIERDNRGIPHVRARNERDMFFGQGFAVGCDRLFQIDIFRRLVAGRLAEVFGSLALSSDEAARVFDINGTVDSELHSADPHAAADLSGFTAGVNAAMAACPLPPEFRALGYTPEPWRDRDALLVAFATVSNLADSWNDVLTREDVRQYGPPGISDALFPITDPAYDSPIAGVARAPVAPLPALTVRFAQPQPLVISDAASREGLGSNDFAAGAALTATHRALLANDPHLQLRMPGIWYLVDLAAPGYHAAGATLAGVPGIILGHNEHLAWGVTNGTVATTRLYRETFRSPLSDEYRAGNAWIRATHRRETFHVRFGKDVTRDYISTRHGFVFADRGIERYAAAWTALVDPRTGYATYDGLARARDFAGAERALAAYPGPPQNFVLADARGSAAYRLAGDVWLDSTWSLGALDGSREPAPSNHDYVSAGALPNVSASRSALVYTANDRTYGRGYPYRLTSNFEAPYRAARIAQLLRARKAYDVAAFSAIQADITSVAERDLAHFAGGALRRTRATSDPTLGQAAAALADFDGRFAGDSKAAVLASALRKAACSRLIGYHLPAALGNRYLDSNAGIALVATLRMLRERPKGWVPKNDYDAFLVAATRDALASIRNAGQENADWSIAGARTALHAFASFGFNGWNGVRFPGRGDPYSPHAQGPHVVQSFRAVWDVGNWDAGGIVIPQGESGEPGSPHFRDGAAVWLSGRLVPLPFSDGAVATTRETTLVLKPKP